MLGYGVVRYDVVWCAKVRYGAVNQCHGVLICVRVQYVSVWCASVWLSMKYIQSVLGYDMEWYCMVCLLGCSIQCVKVRYGEMCQDLACMVFCVRVWYGVVYQGVLWYGMVCYVTVMLCYGIVQFGMVWFVRVLYGAAW